jgi:hypothetical protein
MFSVSGRIKAGHRPGKEKIMPKNLLLIILVGLFLGCSTTAGRQFDTTAVDRIDVGQTTEAQVISMLGVPYSQDNLTNGITIYNYRYGYSSPIGLGTSIDRLQVQSVDGVVVNKWQRLEQY